MAAAGEKTPCNGVHRPIFPDPKCRPPPPLAGAAATSLRRIRRRSSTRWVPLTQRLRGCLRPPPSRARSNPLRAALPRTLAHPRPRLVPRCRRCPPRRRRRPPPPPGAAAAAAAAARRWRRGTGRRCRWTRSPPSSAGSTTSRSSWGPTRRAAPGVDEPALWRRIDMRGHPDLDRVVNLYGMARVAVRRARGQCEAFWAEYAADDDVLKLLGEEAPSLKSLRLICCQDVLELEEETKKFPLLEELEISLFTDIGGKHVFEEVGRSCPELKHFRLNKYRFHNFGNLEYTEDDDSELKYNKDDDALGIANMHGLRSLQLFGSVFFTNEGLTAILDN